ncbi:EAL domain-containing protein [Glaciecola sp. SC05]|uniref:EAL domain-containing protein n=1 Tax=Glaciecola sp. SC05 TaxID=1987355 RepID=UPI003528FC2B
MKLRRKVFLPLILALAIPVLVVGLYVYSFLVEDTRAKFLQNINETNANVAVSINQILGDANDDLTRFATTRLFQNYSTLDDTRYYTHQPLVYTQLLNYQNMYPNYFLMQLILENGVVDSSVDNRGFRFPQLSVSEWPFFERFISINNGEILYQVELEESTQRFIIRLATAMKYNIIEAETATSTQRTSYFSMSMYADPIVALLSQRFNLPDVSLFVLTPDNQIISQKSATSFNLDALYDINIAGVVAPTTVLIDQREYLLIPHILSADMTLFSILPVRIFNDTALTLLVKISLFLLAFICLISVLGFIILNRLILAPITSMQSIVADISDGKMDTVIPAINSKDELGFLAKAIVDMRQRITSNQRSIEQLAFFDSLTHLPNRRTFQSALDAAIQNANHEKEHFAVAFMDLDNFKRVNDTLGHEAGDELLQHAAKRIRRALNIEQYTIDNVNPASNQSAFLARLGGDEFTILMPIETGNVSIRSRLTSVIGSLSEEFIIKGNTVSIGASIGVATYPSSADNARDLLKHADLAMYEAKRTGKNNIVFYLPEMQKSQASKNTIEMTLKEAIEQKAFSLSYYPRIKLTDYSVVAMEMGVKWEHSSLAELPPQVLHGYMQANMQLREHSRWLITEALANIKRWLLLGYADCSVAINVSSVQLEDAEFVNDFRDALYKNDISSKHLIIEITAVSSAQNTDVIQVNLGQLHALGISITLNDFAKGVASFQQIRDLAIAQIKLEQTFVADAAQGNAEMLKALITLSKSIGVRCIVNSVASSTQHDALLLSGCEYGQGPYYSRPLNDFSVDAFIKSIVDKHDALELQSV